MKKLLFTAILVALSVATYAQGTVNFSNYGVVSKRVNYSNNTADFTSTASYTALHGTAAEVNQYTVSLNTQSGGTLSQVATTPIGYNNKAGYFNGGTATVPNTKGGDTVSMVLQVWQTSISTYAVAKNTTDAFIGQSDPFNVTLGGGSTPAAALGFTAFTLHQVPEPTTIALGLFGVAGLFLARRRQ